MVCIFILMFMMLCASWLLSQVKTHVLISSPWTWRPPESWAERGRSTSGRWWRISGRSRWFPQPRSDRRSRTRSGWASRTSGWKKKKTKNIILENLIISKNKQNGENVQHKKNIKTNKILTGHDQQEVLTLPTGNGSENKRSGTTWKWNERSIKSYW